MATFTLQPNVTDTPAPDLSTTPEPDIVVIAAGATGAENDFIQNFSTADKIDVSAYGLTAAQVQTLIDNSQSLPGAVRIVGQNFSTLTLVGITKAQLTSANFIISGQPSDTVAPTAPRPLNAEVFVVSRDATNPTNGVIGSVQATDNVGVTGYELVSPPANFSIDSVTGAISVTNASALGTSPITLQVRARDAAGNFSTAGSVTVFTSLQDAVNSNLVLADGVDNSFIDPVSGSTGLGAIKVAEGNYQPVALYEKPNAGPIRLIGPNAGTAGFGTTRQAEARILGAGIFFVGGIQDGAFVDGFEVNGGRVQLYDANPNPGSARNNLAFRNNIFRGNASSDPTIQIETAPGGPISNNIVINSNWFDGIGPRAAFQAVPQAILVNNVSGVSITNNRINDYGPGAQGFGILNEYGNQGIAQSGNTFLNIGIADVSLS